MKSIKKSDSDIHDEVIEYLEAREHFLEVRNRLSVKVNDVTEVLNSVCGDIGKCADDSFGWDIDVKNGETVVRTSHDCGRNRYFRLEYLKYSPVYGKSGCKNSNWRGLEDEIRIRI